jgi:hypothetical protein
MVKAEIFGPHNYDSCVNRVNRLTGILLIFHPGCGHCVQMRPEWDKMKQRLSASTRVMEIDGSEMSSHPKLSASPAASTLEGFPRITRMENGKVAEEFKGPRVAEELKKFAEKGKKGIKRKRTNLNLSKKVKSKRATKKRKN